MLQLARDFQNHKIDNVFFSALALQYREFFRSNSKSPVPGKIPVQGFFHSNSKSPVQGKRENSNSFSTGKTVKTQSLPEREDSKSSGTGKTVKTQSPPVQEIIFPVQGKSIKTQSPPVQGKP